MEADGHLKTCNIRSYFDIFGIIIPIFKASKLTIVTGS